METLKAIGRKWNDISLIKRILVGLIIGAVLYSNVMGELGRTTQAERLLENLIKERKTQL